MWIAILEGSMMVNFTVGWPDIWSNVVLGVSVKWFWVRLIFKPIDGAKQTALHNVAVLLILEANGPGMLFQPFYQRT